MEHLRKPGIEPQPATTQGVDNWAGTGTIGNGSRQTIDLEYSSVNIRHCVCMTRETRLPSSEELSPWGSLAIRIAAPNAEWHTEKRKSTPASGKHLNAAGGDDTDVSRPCPNRFHENTNQRIEIFLRCWMNPE